MTSFLSKSDPFNNISKTKKIKSLKISEKDKQKYTTDEINMMYFMNSELFKTKFADLNFSQLEIVLHKEGSILVSAVPGAGKTKVVSKRVAHLIDHHKINPSKILVITFTKKAALELKERIENIISVENADDIVIGTFHSVCHRFIKALKIQTNFTVLDEDIQKGIISSIIMQYACEKSSADIPSKKLIFEFLNKISALKNNMVSVEEFRKVVKSKTEKELFDLYVYEKYETYNKEHNYLDFDDLLIKLLNEINSNPNVKNFIENRFDYIFVDEFQDTNSLQFEIISSFAKLKQNIMVVGDTDQSIYRWRFADSQIISKFMLTFEGYTLYKLEQNYRSTQHIVSCSNSVIMQDNNRLNNNIWTNNEIGHKVLLHLEVDPDTEANFIAQEIIKLKKTNNVEYGNIVILLRTNAQSRSFETIFSKIKIPYKMTDSQNFYGCEEIQNILSFLRFIVNKKDTISFAMIVNAGKYAIEEACLLLENNDWSMVKNHDLFKTTLSFKSLVDILDQCDLMITNKKIVSDIMLYILETTKYKQTLDIEYDKSTVEKMWDNIGELINFATRYYTIETFLIDTQLTGQTEGKPIAGGKVNLMTIHSAKGLEWDYVFVPSVVEGIIPHSRSLDLVSTIDEERRLLYVAMTRAKKQLYLTYCKKIMIMGKIEYPKLSRFLNNLPSESTQHI